MGRKNESKSTRRVTSGAAELLNIAAKAGQLANQVSRETEAYRMADVSDFMDGYAGATIFRGIAMK